MFAEPREGGWADLRGPEPRLLPALLRDGVGSPRSRWDHCLVESGDKGPRQLRAGGSCFHASLEVCFQLFARLEMEPELEEYGFFFF